MKRKLSIQKACKEAYKTFCKGCNAFEVGLRKGMVIADNSPLPSCVGNVVIDELTDDELFKFKASCKSAYDYCIQEIEKRKLY